MSAETLGRPADGQPSLSESLAALDEDRTSAATQEPSSDAAVRSPAPAAVDEPTVAEQAPDLPTEDYCCTFAAGGFTLPGMEEDEAGYFTFTADADGGVTFDADAPGSPSDGTSRKGDTPTAQGRKGYDIKIKFEEDGSATEAQIDAVEDALHAAEAYWEDRILGFASSLTAEKFAQEGGALVIEAEVTEIDGRRGILGEAGLTEFFDITQGIPKQIVARVSTEGFMHFDSADLDVLLETGQFENVVRHEIAHVIGFTNFTWGAVGATDGTGEDASYTGARALEVYQNEFDWAGFGDPVPTFIPVETDGGSSTVFAHWDERDFGDFADQSGLTDEDEEIRSNPELMTGYLSPDANDDVPLSRSTLASFDDIGYSTVATLPILITEIMYDPSVASDDWEWIEIYNNSFGSIDLTGWVIDNDDFFSHFQANISGGTLEPGETAILYNSDDVTAAEFEAAWGMVDNLIGVSNWNAMSLSNEGDTIALWDSYSSYFGDSQRRDNAVFSLEYDNLAPWPVGDGAASIYLNSLDVTNHSPFDGANWSLSTVGGGTPVGGGYASAPAGGNPGGDVGSPGVPRPVINEWVISHEPVLGGTESNRQFIEVLGAPNTDYSGIWILEINGDGDSAGNLDNAIELGMTDANGYFLWEQEFNEGSSTFLLVTDFSGTVPGGPISGGDIDTDTDNDGVFDNTPWGAIIDSVGQLDRLSPRSDIVYSSTVIQAGFDGNPTIPGGASRIPNGADTDTAADWVRNDFGGNGLADAVDTPNPLEAVNTPGADNVVTPQPELTVVLDDASISEGDGIAATSGTVTRTGDTSGALTVTLVSDDSTEATVPATVTIAAGDTAATFDLAAIRDFFVDGTQTATITASAVDFVDGTDTIDIEDADSSGPLLVTTDQDIVDPTDGVLSLREALAAANDTVNTDADGDGNDADTIAFSPTVFAGVQRIVIDRTLAQLTLDSDITIDGDTDGDGAANVILNADGSGSPSATWVFSVASGTSTLRSLILEEGAGAPTLNIAPTGTLTVIDSEIRDSIDSSGIVNQGDLTLANVTISGNPLTGLDNSGTLRAVNTTLALNGFNDTLGGGLENSGNATLSHVTITDNAASISGSGILNGGVLTLDNTIVLGNDPGSGVSEIVNTGTLTPTGSLLPGDAAAVDVFDSAGLNGGGGLAANGGAVRTAALRADLANPAIDAGTAALPLDLLDLDGDADSAEGLPVDARGTDRSVDAPGVGAVLPDIGAYEVQTTETPGPDLLAGAGLILAGAGGNDSVTGSAGDDGLVFDAEFDENDHVDAGAGTTDQIGLQGDYATPVRLVAGNTMGVEQIVLLPGSDTRFDPTLTGSDLFHYNLIVEDGAIDPGEQLVFQANTLQAGESFELDASAELDGAVFTYGGLGTDILRGSQQSDAFFFGTGRFGPLDRVDGEGGALDSVGLQGDFSAGLTFGADQLEEIEILVMLSNNDTRFGGAGSGTPYSYTITMDDGNVAAGDAMIVSANTLVIDEALVFDGSAETDGRFRVFSGNGDDTVRGSQGNDEISGRGGADLLTGNGGIDSFIYTNLGDSAPGLEDTITDFTQGDKINLAGIDADSTTPGVNDAFSFAGSAVVVPTPGTLVAVNLGGNDWRVSGDVDGDGTGDITINVTTSDGDPLLADDFIL